MYNYCTDNIRWLETLRDHAWLRDRYLMVRHRDMSLHPLRTAEQIYQFTGETLTGGVRGFIRDITRGITRGGVPRGDNEETALTVVKNSSQVVDKWQELRTYGKYRNMETVEGQCGVLLGVLGEERYFDGLSRAERGSVSGDLGG
ncbi:carbohydrate sulfotransferase 3-like [Bolinopsis microptera]|uniref:carbohydrate sulfotransferase 3-like n=1 Tax=Bolinopsis microptera TaxID=2820187 RepID=UPI00307906EF